MDGVCSSLIFPVCEKLAPLYCTWAHYLGAENSNVSADRAGWLQELVYFFTRVLNWLGVEGLLAAPDQFPRSFLLL